jgi:large subunit ribosomal protein L14
MIQVQTQIKVIDNSGVKKGQVIKVYKGKRGNIGDIIQISVKQIQSKTKFKISKGNIFKALIVRTRYKNRNLLNNYIAFNENSIILLNNQNIPIASRILGPIPIQLRKNKQVKILSLASTLI